MQALVVNLRPGAYTAALEATSVAWGVQGSELDGHGDGSTRAGEESHEQGWPGPQQGVWGLDTGDGRCTREGAKAEKA